MGVSYSSQPGPIRNNSELKKLIENERYFLPDDVSSLLIEDKTNNITNIKDVNPSTKFLRVGEAESPIECYRRTRFLPYLKAIDLILKNNLHTCLEVESHFGHFVYLARTRNIDCYALNKSPLERDIRELKERCNGDCLIQFDLNEIHKLNHFFDIITQFTFTHILDDIAFNQLLKILSNKTKHALLKISDTNYGILKKNKYLDIVDYFVFDSENKWVFIRFNHVFDLGRIKKFVSKDNMITLDLLTKI